jgi:hypothetical protein
MVIQPHSELRRFKFRSGYFLLTILVLIIEILIAVYAHDELVRPYLGDFLVVILIYCLVKSFLNISIGRAAISVLIFSYVVETLQYFQLVKWLHLEESTLARTIIGTHFTWIDIWMYTLGIAFVLLSEFLVQVFFGRRNKK